MDGYFAGASHQRCVFGAGTYGPGTRPRSRADTTKTATPDGGRITTRAAVDGHDRVEIAVSDTGVGIAPADLPHVFAEFERVGSGYSRSQQGSGLGLALVKRFAEMMGGTVSVASVLGQGSTFTVHLPVRQL